MKEIKSHRNDTSAFNKNKPQTINDKQRHNESKKQIVKHFEQFILVGNKLEVELLKRVSIISYKKGELIIDANKIGDKSYFILEGLTRTYSLKDSKEVIEYFSSKNEWANSPRSWRTGKPDIYYVDAIEDTEALCVKATDMLFLFTNFPELERYGRLSMITLLCPVVQPDGVANRDAGRQELHPGQARQGRRSCAHRDARYPPGTLRLPSTA